MPLTLHAAHTAARLPVADLDTVADLPHVEPDMARLSNRLTCHAAPLSLRVAGRDWRMRFVTADAALAVHGAQGYAFTLGQTRGRLCLDAGSERALLGVPGAAEALPQLLRHALLADACSDLTTVLATVQSDPFTWHPAPAGWPSNLAAFGVTLDTVTGDSMPMQLRAVLQLEHPDRLARLAHALPALATASGERFDALQVPVAVRIGTTTIAIGDTHGIVPGDIISIERWQSQPGGLVVRCGTARGGASWMALAEGRRISALHDLTVLKGDPMEGTDTLGMPHPDATQLPLAQLDGLEVELRFEVGGVAIPLADLRAVRGGYVFELPQPLKQSEVRIIANGTRIGTGTLIAVGNRLGVRVTTFAAGDA